MQSGLTSTRPLSSATEGFGCILLEGACERLLLAIPVLGVTRTGDFSDLARMVWLLLLVRITVPLETLLMEDFEGEGLEWMVEVGVCGLLRGCRCLAARD